MLIDFISRIKSDPNKARKRDRIYFLPVFQKQGLLYVFTKGHTYRRNEPASNFKLRFLN